MEIIRLNSKLRFWMLLIMIVIALMIAGQISFAFNETDLSDLIFSEMLYVLIEIICIISIIMIFRQMFKLFVGIMFSMALIIFSISIVAAIMDEEFGSLVIGCVLASFFLLPGIKIKKLGNEFYSNEKLNHSKLLKNNIRFNCWVIIFLAYIIIYGILSIICIGDIGYYDEFDKPVTLGFAIGGPIVCFLSIINLFYMYSYNYKGLNSTSLICGILTFPLGIILLFGRRSMIRTIINLLENLSNDANLFTCKNWHIREFCVDKTFDQESLLDIFYNETNEKIQFAALKKIEIQDYTLTKKEFKKKVVQLLDKLIRKDKSIIYTSKLEEIQWLIKTIITSRNSAIQIINVFKEVFSKDLIEELKCLSSNYIDIKNCLSEFIEFGIVEGEYPHKMI
jgi:hypothetical protein